jgi:hypothetical protein
MLTMPRRNQILAGPHQGYSSAQLRSCFTADQPASMPTIRACYSLKSFLIQSKVAARQRTPMKDLAVFS